MPTGGWPRLAGEKLKKREDGTPPAWPSPRTPDILETIATLKQGRPHLVVGFAAETENVIAHAQAKLARKGCDLIVANDVSAGQRRLGRRTNTVHLVSPKGVESWPGCRKTRWPPSS